MSRATVTVVFSRDAQFVEGVQKVKKHLPQRSLSNYAIRQLTDAKVINTTLYLSVLCDNLAHLAVNKDFLDILYPPKTNARITKSQSFVMINTSSSDDMVEIKQE